MIRTLAPASCLGLTTPGKMLRFSGTGDAKKGVPSTSSEMPCFKPDAGCIYANPIPFSIYYFSNLNILMLVKGVFEGAESNEINFM